MKTNALYDSIGRAFGRDKIRQFGLFLTSGGFAITPERFAGLYVVFSTALSLLVSAIFLFSPMRDYVFRFGLLALTPLVLATSAFIPIFTVLLSFFLVFSLAALFSYVFILLAADRRRSSMEDALPDFLILAAANSRAGMTIDQALWHAAKPEFGLLADEVQVVAKRTFGGVPFDESIDYLAHVVDSKIIRRTVILIKQGLASGSRIAVILERTAQDVRDMQIVKRDIAASLLMYIIFIVFAAAIGTPFLFAVSAKLVMLMEEVFTQLPETSGQMPSAGSTFIQPQPPIVSSDQFFIFVLISLLVTSVTSSLLIGVIQKGNKREGIKYLPFILILGSVLFFVVIELIGSFVRGLGGG